MGGLCTIGFCSIIITYLSWRIYLYSDRAGDQYFTSSYFSSFLDQGAHMLSDDSIYFNIYVNDENFDNDDNPYGKLVYHNYINMEGPQDKSFTNSKNNTLRDEIIPLQLCPEKVTAIW